MIPFDKYPQKGYALIGGVKGSNCRHEYCLEFMIKTGQRKCAYCNANFESSYETWLTMALDHVVPFSVCELLHIPDEWSEDCSNKVLACAACNTFLNRYKAPEHIKTPRTVIAFFNLRDKIYKDRKRQISQRHKEEKEFFYSKPWTTE